MFYLETPRLILVQTPLHVVQMRLQQDSFRADVALPAALVSVEFPPEWPADALVLFPIMLEQYAQAPEQIAWGGTLILRDTWVAVGQVGCKTLPQAGSVEIGYGINPAYQRRGFAGEIVQAFTDWILQQPAVQQVVAECRIDNAGSIRVLQKTGFRQVGQRYDIEDGPLLMWEHTR